MDLLKNETRLHIWQVQRRDSAATKADYDRDGMGHLADTEWSNVLKKPYPWKTASRHFRLYRQERGKWADVRFIRIDRETGEVRVVAEVIYDADGNCIKGKFE